MCYYNYNIILLLCTYLLLFLCYSYISYKGCLTNNIIHFRVTYKAIPNIYSCYLVFNLFNIINFICLLTGTIIYHMIIIIIIYSFRTLCQHDTNRSVLLLSLMCNPLIQSIAPSVTS